MMMDRNLVVAALAVAALTSPVSAIPMAKSCVSPQRQLLRSFPPTLRQPGGAPHAIRHISAHKIRHSVALHSLPARHNGDNSANSVITIICISSLSFTQHSLPSTLYYLGLFIPPSEITPTMTSRIAPPQ